LRLLAIEDNPDMLANLADYLSLRGYVVDCAADGLTGLHLAATQEFDLVILDVMLPGLDGYSLAERLRQGERSELPIIMLTARDALEDRLRGFRAGVDDYLTKPFAMAELAARIEAVLKRTRNKGRRELQVADLRYDLDTLEVTRAGIPIQLSPIGRKLLAILMQRSPAVVRRDTLEEELWGDSPPDSHSLRTHIHSLRQQVDRDFSGPLIHTVHGIGYRLAEHP
jgi:DNA-binding response OmpR family regulator